MHVYEPKSFCFCFDLKNGCLFVGSFCMIVSLLNILGALSGQLYSTLEDYWYQATIFLPAEYQQHKENYILFVMIAGLACVSLMFIFSCLLIRGIIMDRPGLMLPALSYGWTLIILNVVSIILMGVSGSAHSIPLMVIIIFGTIIETYFVLVINAYHTQVKRTLSESHVPKTEQFEIDNISFKVKV